MESIDHDFQQTEPLGSCGKRCYTYRQAREIINYAPRQARHGKYKNIPKREYWCPVCKAYHVTHYKSEQYDSYDKRGNNARIACTIDRHSPFGRQVP